MMTRGCRQRRRSDPWQDEAPNARRHDINFGTSESKQKSGGTTQLQIPAPSPDEQELRALNLQMARRQLAAMTRAEEEQTAQAASPQAAMEKDVQSLALQNLLARLRGTAPVLSPEAQQRIDTMYGASREEGLRSINDVFMADALRRGMTPTDSPIANAKGLAVGDFLRGLGAAKAQAGLDVGQADTAFNMQMQQFQNSLRQQAFQNRLALAGTTPAAFGLQQSLFGQRAAGAPQLQSLFGNMGTTGWGMALTGQGAGNFMSGLGRMGVGGGGLGSG